jgi:hypothetical protein
MAATEAYILYVVKPNAHLRYYQRIGREFKEHFVLNYPLKINDGGYCVIEVIAPSADNGVPVNYSMFV